MRYIVCFLGPTPEWWTLNCTPHPSPACRTDLQHASGTRVMIDFVETPSTLMENFVWDHRVLSLFAKHYITGETIPAAMVQQLQRSRYQFSAVEMEQQVLYSLVDQVYHSADPLAVSTTESFRRLQDEHTQVSHAPHPL